MVGTYRDDHEAALERVEVLEQELSRVRGELAGLVSPVAAPSPTWAAVRPGLERHERRATAAAVYVGLAACATLAAPVGVAATVGVGYALVALWGLIAILVVAIGGYRAATWHCPKCNGSVPNDLALAIFATHACPLCKHDFDATARSR